MLTRVGWEPAQTWPVPRPGRTPLVFQTRLPAAEFVGPRDLPERDRATPASVGTETITLDRAAQVDGVFLAAAIRSTAEMHGVLATMTAALTPKPLPFLDGTGTEQRRRDRRRVKGMIGRTTVIERPDEGPPPPGEPDDARPLIVQYVVRTRHSALTLTFRTEGAALAGNARRLFQNIVRGSYLGPKPL